MSSPNIRHTGNNVSTKDKAIIHAMAEMGDTKYRIAKSTGYCWNTVNAVLQNQEPPKQLVSAVVKRELAELDLLRGLARNNLMRKLSEGEGSIIENTAVMDKTFQQRRLICGETTENVGIAGIIMQAYQKQPKVDKK